MHQEYFEQRVPLPDVRIVNRRLKEISLLIAEKDRKGKESNALKLNLLSTQFVCVTG